jgi:hypothetical protein
MHSTGMSVIRYTLKTLAWVILIAFLVIAFCFPLSNLI